MPSPCARSPPHAPVFCRFAIARQLMNPYRSFLFMHRNRCGIYFGRLSGIQFMHRNRCGCFWFSRLFIPYSDNAPARCVSFTPRGGGQRERRRTLRSPSPFSPTPLNLFPGNTAAAGLIRLPRVYRDIVCAIQVLSLIATSIFRAAICVRACIVRVSVGM